MTLHPNNPDALAEKDRRFNLDAAAFLLSQLDGVPARYTGRVATKWGWIAQELIAQFIAGHIVLALTGDRANLEGWSWS